MKNFYHIPNSYYLNTECRYFRPWPMWVTISVGAFGIILGIIFR